MTAFISPSLHWPFSHSSFCTTCFSLLSPLLNKLQRSLIHILRVRRAKEMSATLDDLDLCGGTGGEELDFFLCVRDAVD